MKHNKKERGMSKEPNKKQVNTNSEELESIEQVTYDPSQTFLTLEDLEERVKND